MPSSQSWRVDTAVDPGEGEHQWMRFYLGDELADVRCAKCGERPLDTYAPGREIGKCHGTIRALIGGFLR